MNIYIFYIKTRIQQNSVQHNKSITALNDTPDISMAVSWPYDVQCGKRVHNYGKEQRTAYHIPCHSLLTSPN